ncbi:glycogen-binding domain-containing protein [Flaviramulus sp. BrNp1-15]|uniref:glycogen-binding domain-containing protein n=1 Tax=Flaviramulus sp. BrNp1-15 TaxID=2916754 RepID=UPI001EE800DE|nr:glycogen-binding domain-containing protein [Flaviramulus sp. BrNp1-15]ULC58374.1 glycogen-binding domain-containing protein [Flaviramulus sp. BrNp1-15]
MNKLILHIIIIITGFVTFNSYAQKSDFKGYRIEGDTIVFAFDKRDYNKISTDNYGLKRDFDDLDIESVVVSGEFNNWSKDKWRMTKIDENRYELRKKIDDFTDEFTWEFKFVINDYYWAEPSKSYPNIAKSTKDGMRLNNTYNLKMYTAYPSKDGNAYFKLKGYDDAKKVIVAGSFNKWDEELFKMTKTKDGWELTLQIKPGVYQYRFIVDGHWMEDPHNPHKTRNEFSEYNSVLDIKEYTAFKLRGYTNAQKVILSGTFNNWNEHELVMRKMDYGWKYVIPLTGGKHHYKFIVDGQWIVDPNNSVKEYDGEGHINSVCMVK